MIEVPLSDSPRQPVLLEPSAKRSVSSDLQPARDLMELGTPVWVELTRKMPGITDDLKQFLGREAGIAYYLVHLTCDFLPREDQRVAEAWLQIKLGPREAIPTPIAWSMDPLCLEEKVEVKQKASIGGDLKFLSSELGEEETRSYSKYYVMAHGEAKSEPLWHFREIDTRQLNGIHRLMLIVRAPAAVAVDGTLNVSASVRRHALKLFPYRAVLADTPAASFTLRSGSAS